MEQNILYSMGKEGATTLVSLLSKSLEPVVDMHNNDSVICSCDWTMNDEVVYISNVSTFYALSVALLVKEQER